MSVLLARYGALASRTNTVKSGVAKAISDATGVRVEAQDVEVGEGEVRLKVSGARRAAIFMKLDDAARAAARAIGGEVSVR